jgi:hypothetical protein
MGMPETTERLLTLLFAIAATLVAFAALMHQVMSRRADQHANLRLVPDPYVLGFPREGLLVQRISAPPNHYVQIGGAIENTGPHAARAVRMCVFHVANVLENGNPPQSMLFPDDGPHQFDFSLPLSAEPATDFRDEPVAAYPHGMPIRVQFSYRDGDPATVPFSRCFQFRWADPPEQSISVLVPCPRESFAAKTTRRWSNATCP